MSRLGVTRAYWSSSNGGGREIKFHKCFGEKLRSTLLFQPKGAAIGYEGDSARGIGPEGAVLDADGVKS
jgi:hypothetical protein